MTLGQLIRGDGGQEETVQRQLDIMQRKFYELKPALTDSNILLSWRLQYYVAGVLSTSLHNVGGWLLDPKTQRKLNGLNSRLLAQITRRSVRQEASQPTLCAVQWARVKRAKWLGHILREDEMSLVKKAILRSHARGDLGTLMDEAPPHRSIAHLTALASKRDGCWEDWCAMLARKEWRRVPQRGTRVPPTITRQIGWSLKKRDETDCQPLVGIGAKTRSDCGVQCGNFLIASRV